MGHLVTTIDIEAPAARVWHVLADFGRYPEWNPYIAGVGGELTAGSRLQVTVPPVALSSRPRTFCPTVLDVDPEAGFRWVAVIRSARVFRGEHYFRLESLGANRTRLVHGERFSGLILPLHRVSRYRSTRRGFERMNAALKRRVESAEPVT
ncbi:MAG TPA: SRPBCC domain-containing protein [Solirubrobacteraceae bacterium]|jgi:hypothetical protein